MADYHFPEFLDWASRQVVLSVALNADLDTNSLLASLLISRDGSKKTVDDHESVVAQVRDNIIALSTASKQFKGTVFGDVLQNALQMLVKELEGHEKSLGVSRRNLQLIQIFIDSIESATQEDEGVEQE